jgi:hypothetical protein
MSADSIYHWNDTVILGRGIGGTIIDFALSPIFAYKNSRFIEQSRNRYKVLTEEQARQRSYLSQLIFFQRRLIHHSSSLHFPLGIMGASLISSQILHHLPSALSFKKSTFSLNGILVIAALALPIIFYKIIYPSANQNKERSFTALKDSLLPLAKKAAIPFLISIGIIEAFYLVPRLFPQCIVQLNCSGLMRNVKKITSIILAAALIRRITWWCNRRLREITRAQANQAFRRQPVQKITDNHNIVVAGAFSGLPTELLCMIFSFVPLQDIPKLKLVSKGILKVCTQELPVWDRVKFRNHLHPHVLQLLEKCLGKHALAQFQEVKLSSKVVRPAINEPISSFLKKNFLKDSFRPGLTLYWLPRSLKKCISLSPTRWPLMQTIGSPPAPFPLEIVTDLLEPPSAAYAWTSAGTLVLYFPHTITFYNFYEKRIDTKQGVWMLAQASNFDNKEWLLVHLDFVILEFETLDIGIWHELYERSPKNLYNYSRFLVYDEQDQLHPDCQEGVKWFVKFLSGEAVEWFGDEKKDLVTSKTSGRCSLLFNHPNLKR